MDIKIEHADPHSSHPLVLDVMGEDGEPMATHVLKFGDFVVVHQLGNLRVVPVEEWTERQVAAEAEAKTAAETANAKAHAGPAALTL